MPRCSPITPVPQASQAWPSSASAMSATSLACQSRPWLTLIRWWSGRFAPATRFGESGMESVGDHRHPIAQPDRRGGAGDEAELLDLGVAHRPQRAPAEGVGELDLVDLQIAAHDGEDRLVGLAAALGHVEDGLRGLRLENIEERGELLDRRGSGRRDLLEGERVRRLGGRAHEGGLLRVGGVAAVGAERDGVLAGLAEEDELLRALAADRARVRLDGDGRHAAAREDAPVGLEHRLVGGAEAVLVGIEGVGVLHRELAHAHQAAARPSLVAELGLDLVERDGQVAVGAGVIGEEAGDHLLMRRPEHELAPALVVEVEEHGAEGLLAPALPPDLHRLDGGQQHLLPARRVHLLAHDGLGLEAGAAAERHVAVGAGHELVDAARAQQQPMARRLRIGGRLAQRASEQP